MFAHCFILLNHVKFNTPKRNKGKFDTQNNNVMFCFEIGFDNYCLAEPWIIRHLSVSLVIAEGASEKALSLQGIVCRIDGFDLKSVISSFTQLI